MPYPSVVEPEYDCSFCGKHQRDVTRLIAGQAGYICGDCIRLCAEVLDVAPERGTVTVVVSIPTKRILDWETFHDIFAEKLGFPNFYGRNMNAWIGCMTYLDDPSASMTAIHVPRGSVLTLQLEDVDEFLARCPEHYAAIVESCAFVNWRRLERREPAVLALSFHQSSR